MSEFKFQSNESTPVSVPVDVTAFSDEDKIIVKTSTKEIVTEEVFTITQLKQELVALDSDYQTRRTDILAKINEASTALNIK